MNSEQMENVIELYQQITDKKSLKSWWSNYDYSVGEHIISGFLIPHLLTGAPNYTCKKCKRKIGDKYQIRTKEPYGPVYHVLCYKKLHEQMIGKLNQFCELILSKVPDDEKKLLTTID